MSEYEDRVQALAEWMTMQSWGCYYSELQASQRKAMRIVAEQELANRQAQLNNRDGSDPKARP